MLDVHVPQATHTWKDFGIHIATICVGLLIAIGLEQGIEFLHHRHEAARLEEDMRAEAAQNVRMIDGDFAVVLPRLAWEYNAVRALRDAPVLRGFVTVVLPPVPPHSDTTAFVMTTPSHSVWTIAQTTGQVALLPLERAKAYDRLEFEAAECVRVGGDYDIELTEVAGVLRSLNVRFHPGEAIHLAPEQRDELVQASNRVLQLQYWELVRLAFWKGASRAVLDNVQNPDMMNRYILREASAIHQP